MSGDVSEVQIGRQSAPHVVIGVISFLAVLSEPMIKKLMHRSLRGDGAAACFDHAHRMIDRQPRQFGRAPRK